MHKHEDYNRTIHINTITRLDHIVRILESTGIWKMVYNVEEEIEKRGGRETRRRVVVVEGEVTVLP